MSFARRRRRRVVPMPDVDLPKAEHVLSVLRQARLSRNETAATMIAELVYEMAYTDLRPPEIEEYGFNRVRTSRSTTAAGNGISGCRDRAPKAATKMRERPQRPESGT